MVPDFSTVQKYGIIFFSKLHARAILVDASVFDILLRRRLLAIKNGGLSHAGVVIVVDVGERQPTTCSHPRHSSGISPDTGRICRYPR